MFSPRQDSNLHRQVEIALTKRPLDIKSEYDQYILDSNPNKLIFYWQINTTLSEQTKNVLNLRTKINSNYTCLSAKSLETQR